MMVIGLCCVLSFVEGYWGIFWSLRWFWSGVLFIDFDWFFIDMGLIIWNWFFSLKLNRYG